MQRNERLTNLLTEFFERFSSWEQCVVKDKGLTLPQMHTIEILGVHGRMRMKELAEKMGITTGTLTVLADRLQDKNLIERTPHEQDRRSILVGLTQKGERHFEEHHRLHLRLTEELLTGLDEGEAETLENLLSKMIPRL
ncbi:MarR family winged helix-turn-helix transcriptional regulator [Desulfovibrio ferrophilus]|uniref:MarR family transcriptional regulator n=1 Tax=Desulfovibrio ferrophilus TaxID=241368 RepID=A0A2Z6AZ73_9BACT|nr:MarR family transcriptional regulator [Desulfovibrio ferrophilus]BBD08567.1 MarR family transcriptional regulator [Desulfovibrio ferrophilus]